MEYAVLIAIAAVGVAWWYYNRRLSRDTRKALENQVKADVKAGAEQVVEQVKRKASRKKKNDNG